MAEITTTPETEVAEVPQGITEEQAVQQLLGKWAKADEAEKQPEKAEEPQAEEATAEPEAEPEADADEEEVDDGDIEIDVGGEKFKFPRAIEEPLRKAEAKVKEIEAGATRKFQEAAELRKAVDAEKAAVTELKQIAEKQSDLLVDHKMVMRRLQQIEGIDIQNTDADTLSRINAEYNQLQAAQRRIEAQYAEAVRVERQQAEAAVAARLEHGQKVLAAKLKNWGPERAKALTEYAIGRGVPEAALRGVTEPWFVEILDDAQYGRQMREHKTTAVKRVAETPKVLKPSASAGKTTSAKAADDAMARLKKSGKTEDAVMALLARSSVRKK